MKHRQILKNTFGYAIPGLNMTCTASQSWTEGSGSAHSMELRRIMQDLGKNMLTVTDGISREDWDLVTETALLIADHPQPPFSERVRVLGFIGSNVGRFRGYDKQTHQAARDLEEAAIKRDGQMVIAAFARLQNSCLACHQSFRKPFVEHFYEQE